MEANLKIVIRENEELHDKLKKQVLQKVKQMEEGTFDLAEAFPTEEWREAQERIAILSEENKNLLRQTAMLRSDIDKLRGENENMHRNCTVYLHLLICRYH
jgi:hypothetical protein